MAETNDVVWLVGRTEEVGDLQEQREPVDATVQETWPCGANAGVVALVRSAGDAAETVAGALDGDVQPFVDEEPARRAAADLVSSA